MGTREDKKLEMIAYEAFIRRASIIDSPFMLKGSYVTRQYFQHPADRIPADLDWLYMHKLTNHLTAHEVFSAWATAVTELDLEDGVKFRSFRENDFWRMIDYAMADDFPTVNTDLLCWVDDIEVNLFMDVSFNLTIEQPSVPLDYKPIRGDRFAVPNTVPLSLQVSWKIHQTLVRPRFKDLFDLTHLVNHPAFDEQELARSFQALLNECMVDEVDLSKVRSFLIYNMEELFPNDSINKTWEYWRYGRHDGDYSGGILNYDKAEEITAADRLQYDLPTFLRNFREIMEQKGWTIDLIKDMDIPPVKKRVEVIEPVEANPAFKDEIIPQGAVEEEDEKPDLLDEEPTKLLSFWQRMKRIFNGN